MTVEEVVLKLTADIREFEREMWKAQNLVRGLFNPAVLFGAIGSTAGGPIAGLLGLGAGTAVNAVVGVVKTVTSVVGSALKEVTSFGYESIKWAVELGVEYERVAISFEVMAGSAEKGRKLLQELNQVAINSPFRSKELLPAAEMLLGFGVDPGNVAAAVDRLGEAAAGSERKLMRLALAYGQVVSAGRLKGGELRQFTESGIGIADFAKTAGVSTAEFQASVSAAGGGRFSTVRVVEETINRLTNQGGRFAGLNERLLGTVGGAYNRLVETFELAAKNAAVTVMQKLGVADRINSLSGLVSGLDMKAIEDWADRAAKGLKPVLDSIDNFVFNLIGRVGGVVDLLPSWDDFGNTLNQLVTTGIPTAVSVLKEFGKAVITVFKGIAELGGSFIGGVGVLKGGRYSPETMFRMAMAGEGGKAVREGRLTEDEVREKARKKAFEMGYDPKNVEGNAMVEAAYALSQAAKGMDQITKQLESINANWAAGLFDPSKKELQKAAVGGAFGGLGVTADQAPKHPARPEIHTATPFELGAGVLGGGLGLVAGGEAQQMAAQMGERLKAYADAQDRVNKAAEKRYTPAAYIGSADAQDTINKAVGAAQDKQQEVIRVIQESNRLLELEQKEAEETNRILRDLEKKGVVLKAKGV